MKKLYRLAPLFMIATVILLQACSAKKNTAGSRFWQSLNTRYNVYYHGKTNYDEQIKVLEDEYQDDYSQMLFVHPAEAKANPKAPQPGGSFDRTIEKMQKAIALHSIKKKPKKKAGKGADPKYKEWMKREEYNPFLHNAWYLLAKSEYMKGDFLNAAATFRYISRHFTWKEDLALEAQVWEALCYCAMGWTNEADNVLAHIHIDRIDNSRIRSLANLAFADYYIKDRKNEQAIPYLERAARGAKGSQKVRLHFLLGQLYEEAGNNTMAYQAYKKAGSSNSSTYRTKFNARIKQSAVFTGYNVSSEVKALRNMARFDRNKEYLDQIYYAIGNLYLSRQDTVHAIENYIKAAEKSTRNGVDKAISQLTLGGIYFAQHKYDKAQPCYSEAIPLINETYPNYKELKQRSDVLDELAVYSQNVTLQDSLLTLSKMPLEEQKKVIKKIIDELKKKEKEEADAAKREEYMAQQAAQGNNMQQKGNQPTTYQINNDNSWYFYNTATKNAGKTQFQQTWGNRKLEDNWRRRNKNTFSLGDESDTDASSNPSDSTAVNPNDSTKMDKEAQKRSEDPHYEEYYLKQIPKTEEQIQAAHDIIVEGLYNMGVILKDKLEDADAAEFQFEELLRRYPDNIYRLDSYYNMYLMYMRYGQLAKASVCRDTILTSFADSKYGQAMQDPNYLDNLKNMEVEQELMYEQAYNDYLANNNDAVHGAYAQMMSKYPLSKIMPKFMFIDALSYVTQKNYDKFKETLKDMLQRYPETDITPVASGMVKQLNSGRKLSGGSTNTRGMIWSTRLGNDTTPADLERKFTPFKEDHDKPHVFILLYPTDSVSSRLLLYEVARHNFNSFVVKDYDLEQMTFGHLGLLVVKGFANYDEVVHYRTVYENDKDKVIPEGLHQVLISEGNFQLLLNEGRSFEDYFNYLESKNDHDVESKVPELIEARKQAGDSVTDDGKFFIHKIVVGDNLSKLAETYGVSVADIKKANNLTSDNIQLDQNIKIPVVDDSDKKAAAQAQKKEEEAKKAQAAASGYIEHVVKSGDNLSKLATTYGVSVADIKKANNLTGDNIQLGQKLKIPAKDNVDAEAQKEEAAKKAAEAEAKKKEAEAKKAAEAEAKKKEEEAKRAQAAASGYIEHVVKSGDN
ncbi:MAG: LysM peptidoglycan-binding domain-containing protein, partial [Muribaculaceae bacterium]|nr:LysM peptidoglycan-binding domain-containing protein [Muribaculaceae bacterium]